MDQHEYQANARQALRWAKAAHTVQLRDAYVELAQVWLMAGLRMVQKEAMPPIQAGQITRQPHTQHSQPRP